MPGRRRVRDTVSHDWIRNSARCSDRQPKSVCIHPTMLDQTNCVWLCAVVSIPAFILWQIRMKLRQKLGIGVFLCLSLCMTVVSSVRFSGTHTHANIPQSWEYFWLEVEACVSVCMVSLCAFRSVFASDEHRARSKKVRPWLPSTVAKLRNHNQLFEGIHDRVNLSIPSATLSGMRTYIRTLELDAGADLHCRCSDCKSLG